MRRYAPNSPQAAARIVALTVIADGDVGAAELALLDELAVHRQLGLEREALHAVVDQLCADLLSSHQLAWSDTCPVDEYTLAELMGEIDDPAFDELDFEGVILGALASDREHRWGRVDADDFVARVHSTVDHGLDRRVQARHIAAACQDTDLHDTVSSLI